MYSLCRLVDLKNIQHCDGDFFYYIKVCLILCYFLLNGNVYFSTPHIYDRQLSRTIVYIKIGHKINGYSDQIPSTILAEEIK